MSYPLNKYDFVVHVWDASEHGLISKTRQIEAAFSQMEDAQRWTSNISSAATTKNIWFQTWPGWLWGTYDHHADHGLDEWLADLLPLSSTFTGHLEGAEALYDGSNHNVIGVRNFLSGTPQLAVLLGMTRAGKSAFMCDLLSQTDPYYDFTLIVEEGLSYGIWTQAQGSTPTVIQPDGDMTLNYLDTQAAPLTNLQITTAAALVAKMAGYPADEDRRSLRLAQITQYVEQLYADRFEEWISEDASRLDLVARQAMAIAEYKTAYLPVTSTFLEAWTEFQHAASEDERQSLIRRWKPEEVSRFLKSPDTERLVRNTAFAFFRTEDYPTHDMLQQMNAGSAIPGTQPRRDQSHCHPPGAVERTAARLRAFHAFSHWQYRPLRSDLHPGIQQTAQGTRRLPHRQPWPSAHHYAPARQTEARHLRGSRPDT